MKNFTRILTIAITVLLFSNIVHADHLSKKYLFAARMNGMQEVPAVSTNALGLANFYLNDGRDTLCFEMTATGLSGAITAIHIHEGEAGTNGSVVVDMMPFLSGNRLKGTLTGSALTSSIITKMFAGELYLNVHTAANANGEIRGQIVGEEDKGMAVLLNGANEVPAVATSATGLGFFMLSKDQSKLMVNIVSDGLSGAITGAHLHKGLQTVNGPVVQDLTSFINGNRISATVDPTAYLPALLGDSLYINIHTAANAGGEIRGQLVMEPYLHFDAALDTAQETHSVMGSGMELGNAVMRMNYTFDTLWYNVQANNLSGAITGAHFHLGGLNTSGGVVVGIPSGNINGNVISGMVTGSALADTFVSHMLEGNIYINIHTAMNPNGEIRGQVYRTFREGYTYHLNGAQEVPMVSTSASGTGMVSIDRNQTNAHYMMVMDQLNGFSAAHFHENVAGQNGGVLYNIGNNFSNGGIFGYWLDTDANTPFTSAMSNKFRKDSVYVNVHTSANANGEIRGNTSRDLCVAIPQSVSSLGGVQIKTELYPNPAHNSATLDIASSETKPVVISIYDVMGRTVWTKSTTLSYGKSRVNIPLDNMNTGVYSVQIRSAEGQVSLKLMKN